MKHARKQKNNPLGGDRQRGRLQCNSPTLHSAPARGSADGFPDGDQAPALVRTISRPAAGTWSHRESRRRCLLPVRMQRGTVALQASVRSPPSGLFFCSLACFIQRGRAPHDRNNRTRPPSGAARAGYAPRYQPRSLVTSQGGATARSARAMPRSGRAARRRFFAPSASMSMPSPAGSARMAASTRPATFRAACSPAKSARRGWSSCSIASAFGPAGSSPATRSTPFPTQMQDGGRCRPRDRHARLFATKTRSP